ncbi:MAG: BtpA/SgcQ family protein [Pseudomonadota bacterium]
MDRSAFRKRFSNGRVAVFPVIHVLDSEQAERNVRTALDEGCAGVFLINHDFAYPEFLPIIAHVRSAFPDIWLGVNFLAVTGKQAFPILARLQNEGTQIDAYWADDARIDEFSPSDTQLEAQEIAEIRAASGWNGLYFGGTAFKKQREVSTDNYATSAALACAQMDVVTTSGIATGQSADIQKIEVFRKACGDTPLALASGITAENVGRYAPLVDAVLVATGINIEGDFYNIDAKRLAQLNSKIAKGERHE